jgi:predicted metalloenzyme YecM
MTLAALLASLPRFSADIETYLKELGAFEGTLGLRADHAGLRIKNPEDVERLKEELAERGRCISSAIVNGREILLYELAEPLAIGPWRASCIELPYPKANHAYEDGFEHVEFVIPSAAETLEDMRAALLERFPHLDLPTLAAQGEYEESLPASEDDQLPNPSLAFEKRRGLAVKFHPRPIQEIVGFE